jgi:hypothetical protein
MGCSLSVGAVTTTCLNCQKFMVPTTVDPDTYNACNEALSPDLTAASQIYCGAN